MKILAYLFLASLLGGQLTGITLRPGITVYPHDIVLVVWLLVWIWQKPKINLRRLSIWPAIAVFGVIAGISLAAQIGRYTWSELTVSSLYLGRWLFYVGVYLITVSAKLSLLPGLYLWGTALAGLGLLQIWLYPDLRNLVYLGWDPHYYRLFSTLLDPNFTGILLVLTLILGLYLWQTRKKLRLPLALAQSITLAGVILTYSRSSYLALITAIFGYFFFRGKKQLAGLLIAGLVILILVWPKPPGDASSLTREVSALARIGNWQQSLQLFRGKPLLGLGFNTLKYNLKLHPASPDQTISRAGSAIDSSLLFVAVTTGILGLASYLWLLVSIWKSGSDLDTKNKALVIILRTSLLAVLIHSLFINSLFYPWVILWLWILLGEAESHF